MKEGDIFAAYSEAYQGLRVLDWYRRNIAGPEKFQPKPRLACVDPISGRFRTNNPCPVCRDEFLLLDYRVRSRARGQRGGGEEWVQNTELVEQFVDARTGEALHVFVTGLCQEQQLNLEAALLNAKRHGRVLGRMRRWSGTCVSLSLLGFLEFDVPFRRYDYAEHYPWLEAGKGVGKERAAWEEGTQPLPGARPSTYSVHDQEFIPDVWCVPSHYFLCPRARRLPRACSDGPYDLYWKRWEKFARQYPQGFARPRKDV